MGKTVLVVDGGGRGSVLVEKYLQSSQVKRAVVVPGNDLVKWKNPRVTTYPQISTTSLFEILRVCRKYKVDLVDVAQDNAVEAGVADFITKNGFNACGPTRLAAQIEWDKAWAREFGQRHKLPQPVFKICHTIKEGHEFLDKRREEKWFVKAYGLFEGKGVFAAQSNRDAKEKIIALKKIGQAAKLYLLEEALVGEEFSAFAVSDGVTWQIVGFVQDHKRVGNFDEGPNTGGMGCVSPPLVLTREIKKQVNVIFTKAFAGLQKEKRPYRGVLYLGGIVVNGKVYVIEFNARWGDPEAQVIIPGVKNDFYALGRAIAGGNLSKLRVRSDKKVRVSVAAASRGYPGDTSHVKGKQIYGLDKLVDSRNISVYGAGVKVDRGKFFASGGRLFHLVAQANNVIEAREKVYKALAGVQVEGNNLHYRTDIGWRDVERLQR